MTIQALTEVFDDWVLNVYQNRKHSSLLDPLDPSVKLSPNEKYEQLTAHITEVYQPLSREDFIDLLPVDYRVVGTVGVQMNNRHYDSVDLHPLRHAKSGDVQHNRKWEVRFDPYNQLCVWVKARDGSYIECMTRDYQNIVAARFDQFDDLADIDRAGHAYMNGIGGSLATFTLAANSGPDSPTDVLHPLDFEQDESLQTLEPANPFPAITALDTFDADEDF